MGNKALVIGLDGATWDILHPAIEGGYLPTLETLLEEGFHGEMESTVPPITPVAWTSFMTGVNPGKHGISGFAQPLPQDSGYEFSMNDSEDVAAKTIWEYLSERGRSVVSLNLPMTYPPFSVNGKLVSGLMTPNVRQQFTHPADLQDELLEREFKPFIKHIAGELPNCGSKEEYKQKIDEMCGLVDKKFEQAHFIDEQVDWDVFFMQIQEVDAIQHYLLGFYEEDHSWYDEEMREYIYRKFYGLIDRRIEEVIDTLGDNALTFIVSDHGFQTCDRIVYLGNWLHDEGFAQSSTTGSIYRTAVNAVKKADVFGLRHHLAATRKIAKQKESMTLNWSRSDAISIGAGNNPIAPIYILESGAEGKRIRDEIAATLRHFEDSETGEPVVEEVIIGEEVYEGPHTGEMPDLLAKGAPGYTFRTARHADKPTIVDLVETTNRPGIHHQIGVLLGTSPSTKGGGHRVNGSLIDVFPTLLYYLGEPIPNYLDGEILDIFTDEFCDETDRQTVNVPLGREVDATVAYTDEDKKDVKDTLSQLGYID